jgi:hypothetical protein
MHRRRVIDSRRLLAGVAAAAALLFLVHVSLRLKEPQFVTTPESNSLAPIGARCASDSECESSLCRVRCCDAGVVGPPDGVLSCGANGVATEMVGRRRVEPTLGNSELLESVAKAAARADAAETRAQAAEARQLC